MIKSGRSEMVESTGRYSGTTVVRSTAEKVLKNHGKNNGTGKFDAFVNKMHSMYKATLLDQDQLEDVMEREYKKMYESVDPMYESATYSVSGNARDPALDTSDPAKAIEHWFKISRQAKMLASIHTLKEADGIKLFKWAAANPDKLTEWHKKYNCPYSIEYILEKTKHVADTSKLVGFVENKSAKDAWEGDMLSIFSAG